MMEKDLRIAILEDQERLVVALVQAVVSGNASAIDLVLQDVRRELVELRDDESAVEAKSDGSLVEQQAAIDQAAGEYVPGAELQATYEAAEQAASGEVSEPAPEPEVQPEADAVDPAGRHYEARDESNVPSEDEHQGA